MLSLYDSSKNLIAQNDNYFGTDSYLNLHLPAGTYYVAVTVAGNQFNPAIPDSGNGGKSTGSYELRLSFQPDRTASHYRDERSGTGRRHQRHCGNGL